MLPDVLKSIIEQTKNLIKACLTYLFIKAAQNNKPFFARLLLILGANINEKDIYGNTALHIACQQRMEQLFNILINRSDLDISIANADGKMAIYLADENNYSDAANQLLVMDLGQINNIPTTPYETTSYFYPIEIEDPEPGFIYTPPPLTAPPALILNSNKLKRENRTRKTKDSPTTIRFNDVHEEHNGEENFGSPKESCPTNKI